jgi:D-alanyl-D-alanine carboxypeptidase
MINIVHMLSSARFSRAVALTALTATACSSQSPATTANPRVAQDDSIVASRIDQFADSVVRSVPIAGMSIVVTRNGRTLVSRGYGVADVNTGRRMTEATASRIGSITKVFTALATMKLVEKGLIDLDAELSTYLPELVLPRVTVRQALNHTSGLPDYEAGAVERWMRERKPITREYVTGLIASQPSKPAGQNWTYNNTGFYLLGLVIEKVSGVSYEEFVEREIARPLGLASTWMIGRRPANAVETVNYYLADGKFVRDSVWDLPGIWAGGGMFSTAADLTRLLQAVARGEAVSAATRDRMLAPTTLPSGARADYGLGIRFGEMGGHPKWGHTGSARSTRAAAAWYPRDSLSVVVLMNTEHEELPLMATDIEGRVARMALGLVSQRREDLRLEPGAGAAYTGIYSDGRAQTLIGERGGVLQFSRVGSSSPAVALLYQGGDEWADPEFADYFFRFQRKDGRVVSLRTYDNGWFAWMRVRQQ